MGKRPAAAQWIAARIVSEGQPPTRARIAAILGVDVTAVYLRAAGEGWKTLDFRRQGVAQLYREAGELAASYAGEGGAAEIGQGADERGGEAQPNAAVKVGHRGGGPGGQGGQGEADWPDEDPVALLARTSGFVPRQLSRLIAAADRRGGRLDKAQIDGLAALSKMMERWEALARERAVEDQKKNDEELAELLDRIDARIVELAEGEAGRIPGEREGDA